MLVKQNKAESENNATNHKFGCTRWFILCYTIENNIQLRVGEEESAGTVEQIETSVRSDLCV